MENDSKSCMNCKFALHEDFGYSNYTTEGTTFHCLKNLHPEKEGFDEFYGEDKRMDFAKDCAGYSRGDGVDVDCDRENLASYSEKLSSAYSDDPEVKALLDAYEAKP